MSFIAVAYYTENTLYENEIKALKESCQDQGIHLHTKGYRDLGSWVKNCAIKPLFILEMLQKHPFHDILYLDADARVRKYPKLFDNFEGDIGVHFRKRQGGHQELLSGTIFLKNNERVRELIRRWAEIQQAHQKRWDQRVLQDLLKNYPGVAITDLPPTYTQIYDTMRNAGEPVIEHFQASRRVKKNSWIPEIYPSSMVPESIAGIRIRIAEDGTYYIVRKHRRIEQYMDKECVRIANELRWRPKFQEHESLDKIRLQFEGKPCYIVGKGPSLDRIAKRHFEPDCPVICLNESILQVEKLGLANFTICLQQDAKLRDTCYPKHSPIIVSTKAINYYAEKPNVFVFDNTRLGLSKNALSVSAAIVIARRLGVSKFILCCFDACVTKETTYAKCVGYDSTWGGRPARFLDHINKIRRRAGGVPITWVVPHEKEIEDVVRTDAEVGARSRKKTASTLPGTQMGEVKK